MKPSYRSGLKSVRPERLESRYLLTGDLVASQLVNFSSFRSDEIEFRDVQEADFDGDGRVDIAGRHGGEWWVGRASDDGEFIAEHWACLLYTSDAADE